MDTDRKDQLVQDIENLLNTYDGVDKTLINPDLLKFMDETTESRKRLKILYIGGNKKVTKEYQDSTPLFDVIAIFLTFSLLTANSNASIYSITLSQLLVEDKTLYFPLFSIIIILHM